MTAFRAVTKRDKPEAIAQAAASYSELLGKALQVASRRSVRSNALVRELLASAEVEGKASKLNVKAAAITFRASEFKQVWHQLYPWQYLSESTASEIATSITWSLRESIKRGRAVVAQPTVQADGPASGGSAA